MRKYKDGDTVYYEGKEYRVDSYVEKLIFNWETLEVDKPGYRIYDPEEEHGYYISADRFDVDVVDVHHLTLEERVRRIEERLGLE